MEDLVGNIVTIRTVTGEEIIAKMLAYNPKNGIMDVDNPLVVLLDQDGSVMTVPYSLTGVNDKVSFSTRNVFSVTVSTEVSAQDYLVQTDK